MPGKKILIVIPSLYLAGAELATIDIINHIASGSLDIHIITLANCNDGAGLLKDEKVTLHSFPRAHRFDLLPVLRISNLIKEHRFSVVYCVLPVAFFYGSLGRFLSGVRSRIVVSVHKFDPVSLKEAVFERLVLPLFYDVSDKIVCVCAYVKNRLIGSCPRLENKAIVAYNGIDTDRFKDDISYGRKKELRSFIGLKDGDFVIGMVGGLRPEKRHEDAIAALKIIKHTHTRAKLVIVGEGDRRRSLESMSSDNGVADNIVWIGKRTDPREIISIFDIYLQSSMIETFSIAALEALSMGKPVIATAVGGTAEMIKDGLNGYLVRAGSPQDIAGRIISLMDNPDILTGLSKNARASAEKQFNIERTVRIYEELFMNLSARKVMFNA